LHLRLRTGAALFGRQRDTANKSNHYNGKPGTGHVIFSWVHLSEMSASRFRLNKVFTMLPTLIYGRLTEMEQTKNYLSLSR